MPIHQRSVLNKRRRKPAWWKRWAMAAVALFVTTCATGPAPRAVPVPRPAESRPVTPTADKVKKQVAASRDTSAILSQGLDRAVAEANRLRQQKAASEAELEALWALLTQEQARAKALWDQLSESQETIEQLQRDANAADVEINQLRGTVDELNARLSDALKWQAKAEPKVAVYDAVQGSLRWILITAAVLLVLYLIIRYGSKTINPLA